jgi:orotidine-5'-phosphate decarboxylase
LPAAADGGSFLERLARRVETVRTTLCLGVDPDPEALPEGWPRDVSGIERLANLLIDAASPSAAAVKVNVAFFEAFGSRGIAALERVRARIPPEIPFVADAKRGDIGSTAARQAVALFDGLDADAITASPYLGRDAIAPLLERSDRFVYVLCRTSNRGAGEFQNLDLDGEPLYLHVARRVADWSEGLDNVGLVVGATAPDELSRIRAAVPQLAFLVPGIGAQGGDVDAVLAHGPATSGTAGSTTGGSLLVNVSRAIAAAALRSDDPEAAVAAAASHWAQSLQC